MPMTYYLENKLLEGSLKATTYTAPGNVYMALFSTNCTKSTAGTELTGNGYARQLVSFGTAANGVIQATGNVTFSATGNTWPTVVNAGIYDANTGGNLMYYTTLNPKTVEAGSSLQFDSTNITITIS